MTFRHPRQGVQHGRLAGDGEEDDEGSEIRSQGKVSEEEAEEGHVDMITKLRRRKGRRFTTSWGPVGFTKLRHPLSIMVHTCTSTYHIHVCSIHLSIGWLLEAV